MDATFWFELEQSLPAVFARKHVKKLLGGLISPGTLANLDSMGLGPSVKVRVGKHVGYERSSFIQWLKTRRG